MGNEVGLLRQGDVPLPHPLRAGLQTEIRHWCESYEKATKQFSMTLQRFAKAWQTTVVLVKEIIKMRVLKFLAVAGLILAVSGTAGAISVPLPPSGDMEVKAYGAFSEFFLVVTDANNPLRMAVGTYNDKIGIGVYDSDAGTAGIQPGFVIYTGANSSVGAPATPPTAIIAVNGTTGTQVTISDVVSGTGAFAGKIHGELYVGGMINTISSNPSNQTVTYNHGPGDVTNPNPQLTFALYNAKVTNMTLNVGTGDQLLTDYTIAADPNNTLHFDVWADATPDASLGSPLGPGQRYQSAPTANGNRTPELPVRDDNAPGNAGTLLVSLSDGTYYDRAGGGWGELDFAGNPADDDQVMWSFVGNPNNSLFEVTEGFSLVPGVSESFTAAADLNGDGDTLDTVNGVSEAAVTVFISGSSDVLDPSFMSLQGQLIPGLSLAPAGKTVGGYGFYNSLNLLNDYIVTADFAFGGKNTGAYDSDPRTFTFQQGFPGGVGTLTQITGQLIIPEPLTVLGVLMGVGGLAGYIRRRFAVA